MIYGINVYEHKMDVLILSTSLIIIIIIIIIIFIYRSWVVTRWQWLFYMYVKYEFGYYLI